MTWLLFLTVCGVAFWWCLRSHRHREQEKFLTNLDRLRRVCREKV